MLERSTLTLAALALLTACASNQGGGEPAPGPNAGGAPPPPAEQAPPSAGARPPRAKSAPQGELSLKILAPREGAAFSKAPVEVVAEVTHRGELRSLTLAGAGPGLQAESLAREQLDEGKPGGGSDASGGVSGGSMEDGDQSFSHTVGAGTDGDRAIARAKVARKVIERILGEWSFSALRGERRRIVVTQAIATLRRERFTERPDGRYRYTATVNMPEARGLVLDALAVERTFGATPYLLVGEGSGWFSGAKLSKDEVWAVRAGLTATTADWLNRWRFRQAGGEKLDKGAVLQRGPIRESTCGGLGKTFGAGLVVVLKGGVSYVPFKGKNHATSAGYVGYLRTKALTCLVYDCERARILAQFTVKSDADKQTAEEATTDSVHQPWVAKDGSIAEEAERYTQLIGRAIASNIMRRLCTEYYANVPAGPSGGLTCPGCGDLCAPGVSVCPACESPLGPSAGSAPAPALGPALYRSRYRFLITSPEVGKTTVTATAVDAAGRRASDHTSFSFQPPDETPPQIVIKKPRMGLLVDQSPVEVLIEVTDESVLHSVSVNGKLLRSAKGKRSFTYRFQVKATSGDNDLEFEAKDAAGNVGRAHTRFTYNPPDRVAPALTIVSPKDGATLGEKQVKVTVRASDDRGVKQVLIAGVPAKKSSEDTWSATITLSKEGTSTIEALARDAAGNGTREQVRVTYRLPDAKPPRLTLIGPKKGAQVTQAPITVAVQAEDERGVAWVEINGVRAQQDAKGRWRVRIDAPREGQNGIEVRAQDAAGNEATLSSQFLFDSTPPEVEASANLTVKGVMKDLSGTLTINGKKIDFDKQTGAYEAKVPPHPDHPDKVVIVAVDELGNRSERIEKVSSR